MVFVVTVAMQYRNVFQDVSIAVLERCLEFLFETTSGAGDVFALLEETRDNFPGGNLEQALHHLMEVKASLQPPGLVVQNVAVILRCNSVPTTKMDESKKSVFSGQLELRSSGGADESQGSHLGLFQLLPDGGEGGRQGPVYRQRHDGGNQQFYLYR